MDLLYEVIQECCYAGARAEVDVAEGVPAPFPLVAHQPSAQPSSRPARRAPRQASRTALQAFTTCLLSDQSPDKDTTPADEPAIPEQQPADTHTALAFMDEQLHYDQRLEPELTEHAEVQHANQAAHAADTHTAAACTNEHADHAIQPFEPEPEHTVPAAVQCDGQPEHAGSKDYPVMHAKHAGANAADVSEMTPASFEEQAHSQSAAADSAQCDFHAFGEHDQLPESFQHLQPTQPAGDVTAVAEPATHPDVTELHESAMPLFQRGAEQRALHANMSQQQLLQPSSIPCDPGSHDAISQLQQHLTPGSLPSPPQTLQQEHADQMPQASGSQLPASQETGAADLPTADTSVQPVQGSAPRTTESAADAGQPSHCSEPLTLAQHFLVEGQLSQDGAASMAKGTEPDTAAVPDQPAHNEPCKHALPQAACAHAAMTEQPADAAAAARTVFDSATATVQSGTDLLQQTIQHVPRPPERVELPQSHCDDVVSQPQHGTADTIQTGSLHVDQLGGPQLESDQQPAEEQFEQDELSQPSSSESDEDFEPSEYEQDELSQPSSSSEEDDDEEEGTEAFEMDQMSQPESSSEDEVPSVTHKSASRTQSLSQARSGHMVQSASLSASQSLPDSRLPLNTKTQARVRVESFQRPSAASAASGRTGLKCTRNFTVRDDHPSRPGFPKPAAPLSDIPVAKGFLKGSHLPFKSQNLPSRQLQQKLKRSKRESHGDAAELLHGRPKRLRSMDSLGKQVLSASKNDSPSAPDEVCCMLIIL